MLRNLRELGFCIVPNVVPGARLRRIAAAYDRAFARATAPDIRTARSGGDTRLVDLVSRGSEFDELYLLEPVLSACLDTLGPRHKLSSFGGRTVLPGARAQALHVDVRRDQDAWPLLGFIVMVDDFCIDNGATRFVPGSHQAETATGVPEGNHRPDHGNYVLACGKAGSVIVYFGSTWHGYSRHRATAPRRSIQGAYVPRNATSGVDWACRVPPDTLERLSPAAKHLLALG